MFPSAFPSLTHTFSFRYIFEDYSAKIEFRNVNVFKIHANFCSFIGAHGVVLVIKAIISMKMHFNQADWMHIKLWNMIIANIVLKNVLDNKWMYIYLRWGWKWWKHRRLSHFIVWCSLHPIKTERERESQVGFLFVAEQHHNYHLLLMWFAWDETNRKMRQQLAKIVLCEFIQKPHHLNNTNQYANLTRTSKYIQTIDIFRQIQKNRKLTLKHWV